MADWPVGIADYTSCASGSLGVSSATTVGIFMTVRLRILLILPLVALLIGPLYAGRRPDFFGVAFFYWYELAAMLVSVAITMIVTAPSSRTTRPTQVDEGPRFSRDPSIRKLPSRALTRAARSLPSSRS